MRDFNFCFYFCFSVLVRHFTATASVKLLRHSLVWNFNQEWVPDLNPTSQYFEESYRSLNRCLRYDLHQIQLCTCNPRFCRYLYIPGQNAVLGTVNSWLILNIIIWALLTFYPCHCQPVPKFYACNNDWRSAPFHPLTIVYVCLLVQSLSHQTRTRQAPVVLVLTLFGKLPFWLSSIWCTNTVNSTETQYHMEAGK